MKFITKESGTRLKMWERTMMPESKMVEKNGKREFEKTGHEVEMTTYTLTDEVGDKLVILSKDNSFRQLEGEEVRLILEVVYNDFQKRNRISLAGMEKLA